MRKIGAFGLLFLLFNCSVALAQSSPSDDVALSLARQILITTHSAANVEAGVDLVIPMAVQQLKRDKADIPDTVIAKFIEVFRAEMVAGIPKMLDMQAAVFAKHYTVDELRAIAAFYESDVGKKTIIEGPLIAKEVLPIAQAWGAATGEHAMQETINKLRAQGVKI
jgi:hypothetical protein